MCFKQNNNTQEVKIIEEDFIDQTNVKLLAKARALLLEFNKQKGMIMIPRIFDVRVDVP